MRFDFWILENVSLENKQFWWQLFVDSFPIFSNLLFISWFIFQTLNRVRYARGGGAQPARNQIPFGFVFSCCVCCVVLCCMFVCLRFIEIAWNCATYQTLICPCIIPLVISILSIYSRLRRRALRHARCNFWRTRLKFDQTRRASHTHTHTSYKTSSQWEAALLSSQDTLKVAKPWGGHVLPRQLLTPQPQQNWRGKEWRESKRTRTNDTVLKAG